MLCFYPSPALIKTPAALRVSLVSYCLVMLPGEGVVLHDNLYPSWKQLKVECQESLPCTSVTRASLGQAAVPSARGPHICTPFLLLAHLFFPCAPPLWPLCTSPKIPHAQSWSLIPCSSSDWLPPRLSPVAVQAGRPPGPNTSAKRHLDCQLSPRSPEGTPLFSHGGVSLPHPLSIFFSQDRLSWCSPGYSL